MLCIVCTPSPAELVPSPHKQGKSATRINDHVISRKTLCVTLRLCVIEDKDAIHLRLTLSRKEARSFVCRVVTHLLFRETTILKIRKKVTFFRHQTLLDNQHLRLPQNY